MEWYGSVSNRIIERSQTPSKLEIGMGATACYWSDRHAYFICDIKDEKHITVQRAKVKCLDYFAGDYEVTPDPNGTKVNLYHSSKGWRERIGKNGLGNTRFAIGHADEYQDPSF